jgi:hypothetical protein
MDDGGYYTPTFWVDGVDSLSTAASISWWWNELKGMISSRVSVPSPVEMNIQVDFGAKADTGMAHVEVVAVDPITFSNLYLTMCVIENDLYGAGQARHQVVRKWLPNMSGTSFSIAQGDTFTHSREFVIEDTWDASNCHVVAFVQDRTAYDVLQSIQSPVVIPTPAMVTNLTATLVEDDIRLDWSPVEKDTYNNPLMVDHYNVYRNTTGFFEPGSDPFTTTAGTYYLDDSGVVGDSGTHYFYWVTAVAGDKESEAPGGVGEFDRSLLTGK